LQPAGQIWLDPLRDRAEQLAAQAARLTIEAHGYAEEAEGVTRAVGLARRGEALGAALADTDTLITLGCRACARATRFQVQLTWCDLAERADVAACLLAARCSGPGNSLVSRSQMAIITPVRSDSGAKLRGAKFAI
jgi:hypothetical protein